MVKKIEAIMDKELKVVKSNPKQEYAELKHLHEDSPMSDRELLYFIKNGHLKTAVWLPLRLVERSMFENYELLEGFVGVHPRDARVILKEGHTELQKFLSIDHSEHIRLANELQRFPPIVARIEDLVVFESHEREFLDTFPEYDV